jgi:hypothetical protein
VVLQHQRAVREPRETSAWVRQSVHQRISHGRTDGLTDCVEPVTAKCPPTHLTRTDGRTDGLQLRARYAAEFTARAARQVRFSRHRFSLP